MTYYFIDIFFFFFPFTVVRSSESVELRQYQTQAAEYCRQISELRRQVTNERFDRARKEEETRRYLICSN